MFGWTSVTHKESYRWLTQDLLQPETIPEGMRDVIIKLSHEMDKLMMKLVSSTAPVLFKKNPKIIGENFDIPLLKKSSKWSMFNIDYYLNDQKKISLENSSTHYDSGLLCLNILSTLPGLELYDPYSDLWIPHTAEDKSIAILWCGKTALEASDGTLRPAVIKITTQLDKPRLSLWYEICTKNQVPQKSLLLNEKPTEQRSNKKPKTKEENSRRTNENRTGIPVTKKLPFPDEDGPSIINSWDHKYYDENDI